MRLKHCHVHSKPSGIQLSTGVISCSFRALAGWIYRQMTAEGGRMSLGGKAPEGYAASACPYHFTCCQHCLWRFSTELLLSEDQEWKVKMTDFLPLLFTVGLLTCVAHQPLQAMGIQPQLCCCSRGAPDHFSSAGQTSSMTANQSSVWSSSTAPFGLPPIAQTLLHPSLDCNFMWRLSHPAENPAGFQDIGLEPEQPNWRAQSRRTGSEQSFWIILAPITPYTSPRSREVGQEACAT